MNKSHYSELKDPNVAFASLSSSKPPQEQTYSYSTLDKAATPLLAKKLNIRLKSPYSKTPQGDIPSKYLNTINISEIDQAKSHQKETIPMALNAAK